MEGRGVIEPWHVAGATPIELSLGTPHRVLDSGSTRPIVFQLEDASGPAGLWVVKLQRGNRHHRLALLREHIGADIAAALGVLTPRIGWLRMPTTPLASDESPLGREAARVYASDAGELAFCSRFLDDATTVASDDLSDLRSVTPEAQDDAIRIFALDVFLRRYDRGRKNSNLLARGGRLLAIDHGMVLADLFRVDAEGIPDPAPQSTNDVHLFGDHVCAAIGRKKPSAPVWAEAIAAVRALSDEQLDQIADAWPAELDRSTMGGPAGMIPLARTFLRARRDDFSRILEHARAVL